MGIGAPTASLSKGRRRVHRETHGPLREIEVVRRRRNMSLQRTTDCRLVDRELDQQFRRPRPELSEEARRHVEACWRCRELYAWISSESAAAVEMSRELQTRICRRLTASLKPVSSIPSTQVSVFQFLLVFAMFSGALIAVLGIRGLNSMNGLQILGITVIFGTGAMLLSASLAWQMAPGRYQPIPAKLLASGIGIVFFAGVALLFPWRRPEAFVEQGWQCSAVGAFAAVPAAILFWLLVRRGMPLSVGTFGSTLGAMAGLLAITVLQLKCPNQEVLHILVWHGGVLIALAGTGVLIAKLAGRLAQHRP